VKPDGGLYKYICLLASSITLVSPLFVIQ